MFRASGFVRLLGSSTLRIGWSGLVASHATVRYLQMKVGSIENTFLITKKCQVLGVRFWVPSRMLSR